MPKRTTEKQYQLYKKIHKETLSLDKIIELREEHIKKSKGEEKVNKMCEDYKEIPIPDEIDKKIKSLSDRLDFIKLNKMQWERLDSELKSLHAYISIYKGE